jgi:hypothetical protein
MPDALTYESHAEVTQAAYLEMLDKYEDVEERIAEAKGVVADLHAERKGLRQAIKGMGIPLAAWDDSRADAKISGQVRQEKYAWYVQLMEWQSKPVGYQATMGAEYREPTDEDKDAISIHHARQIADGGKAAGRAGHERTSNPWSPATYQWQLWDTNWLDGAEELAQRKVASDAAKEAKEAKQSDDAPKRRGRPAGSRNKPKGNGAGAHADD